MAEETKPIEKSLDYKEELEKKPHIKVVIGEHELKAEYREFKSGKKGYGVYGVYRINNWPCRLSLNLIEM